jgi:hypothetical protein
MGLFTRKKEDDQKKLELPNLPDAPKFPELPSLPNLPGDEVESKNEHARFLPPPEQYQEQEKTQEKTEKRTIEISELPSQRTEKTSYQEASPLFSKQPLFIKIDKFGEAAAKFEEIKAKIFEIENAMDEIKNIKEKETAELEAWENELRLIKEKIASIDSSLFSRI